jgi:hypothetical protein
MHPLQILFEMFLYEQVHVREFHAPGWEFKFNSPDFLTAVERATVHMRYRQMGVLNPNEIRHDLGRQPRDDDGGDMYAIPVGQELEGGEDDTGGQPGSPPEGRPVKPDAPSQVGAPSDSSDDPIRGDQHDEQDRESWMRELRTWRRFAIKRAERKRPFRTFATEVIPADVANAIQAALGNVKEAWEVSAVFDEVLNILESLEEVRDA